jgi:hypothetical protein
MTEEKRRQVIVITALSCNDCNQMAQVVVSEWPSQQVLDKVQEMAGGICVHVKIEKFTVDGEMVISEIRD